MKNTSFYTAANKIADYNKFYMFYSMSYNMYNFVVIIQQFSGRRI